MPTAFFLASNSDSTPTDKFGHVRNRWHMSNTLLLVVAAVLLAYSGQARCDDGRSSLVAAQLIQDIKPFCDKDNTSAAVPIAERVAVAHPNDVEVSEL